MGAENFVLSFAIPEKFTSFRKYQRKKKTVTVALNIGMETFNLKNYLMV